MRPNFILPPHSASSKALVSFYRLSPGNDPDDDSREPTRLGRVTERREDLPFKVELWDEPKRNVEQVLAVTANGSIGYAAYFAATREYPDRYITLRHKNSIITRWNGPEQQ
jgi:hypothetical protein